MKYKNRHLRYKKPLRRWQWGLVIAVWLLLTGGLAWWQASSSALPGAAYRYSATACSSNDAECYKYSAHAGVYRMYRGIFGRQPEGAGFSYWSGRLQEGSSSPTDMASALINSSEWKSQFPNISNDQFVNRMYQLGLGRAPDTAGRNYWLGELNSGRRSRPQMAASIMTSSESANYLHGAFMAYFSPPPPPPPPQRPEQPDEPSTPSEPTDPGPSEDDSAAFEVADEPPSESDVSSSGLQISDFAISDENYRSVVLSWTTNLPASSKVNFSTDAGDLYNEQKDDTLTTDHRITVEGDSLRAGTLYYFRITSDDGVEPLTLDGEFNTKPIDIVVVVTDQNKQPVADAEVTIEDDTQTTDEAGEVAFAVKEGEVTIFAKRDEFSQEVTTDIEVPSEDGAEPQKINLSLAPTPADKEPTQVAKKGGFNWLLVLLPILFIAVAVGGFIFWKRRKAGSGDYYANDPLEADNYTGSLPTPALPASEEPSSTEPLAAPLSEPTPPADNLPPPPPMPEPTYQPLENPNIPHHATLPEMVGRYGEPVPTAENPNEPVMPAPGGTNNFVSPTGQPIPQHTSLPDLVENPAPSTLEPIESPAVDDLPVAPQPEADFLGDNSSASTVPPPPESPDEDGSISISHQPTEDKK